MEFVESCKSDTNNGYGPTIKHDSHLLYTLSAIQIAAERNTLDKLDKEKLVNYIKSLQQEDGSFVGKVEKILKGSLDSIPSPSVQI